MLKSVMLAEAAHEPGKASCQADGLGLENLAQVELEVASKGV